MVLLVVIVVAVLAVIVALGRTVRDDGYGLRPPPRSHHWEVDDVWSPDHASRATHDAARGR